ncbi:MAG: cobalamin biosynthesis protein, partial [Lachnospiraceae bacterium]|nr:cobalamin biosynthesis protein [Lachnospiraceae bacterium]
MNVYCIAFSEKGYDLASRIAAELSGEAVLCRGDVKHADWTAEHFCTGNVLVYVGACGIAVRSIAPYVKKKTTDPAVICVDDSGRFVIPLLSGHLGGANDAARLIAGITGGEAVITTATDVNGLFAVDEWAKRQGMFVKTPGRIKNVSGKIVGGGDITVSCMAEIKGDAPEHVSQKDGACDVYAGISRTDTDALVLVPRICVLGIGCRKGTAFEDIEKAFIAFMDDAGIYEEAVCCAASIDLKREELGILEFCDKRGIPFITYSAEELNSVPGDFEASDFVRSITGTDNVCERSAVKAAGEGAVLIRKK